MNLFDKLVSEALKNQPNLSVLKMVVEKELLHHDILRILSNNNLLKNLTFMGGTALRCCYNGIRLSEDLDFTGGQDFTRDSLSLMGKILTDSLHDKYGLLVQVSEPTKDKHNVDTWKIKIETRPAQQNMPAQRINIDICAVSSYEVRPMMILNPYGVDMGTSGLIIQVESMEEIYADKLLAFALRPNRIKYRDLWDILWLHSKNIQPRLELIGKKLRDRSVNIRDFLQLFDERRMLMATNSILESEFRKEMLRFLPLERVSQILKQEDLWNFMICLIEDLGQKIKSSYQN